VNFAILDQICNFSRICNCRPTDN